jgi:hypothetical protein
MSQRSLKNRSRAAGPAAPAAQAPWIDSGPTNVATALPAAQMADEPAPTDEPVLPPGMQLATEIGPLHVQTLLLLAQGETPPIAGVTMAELLQFGLMQEERTENGGLAVQIGDETRDLWITDRGAALLDSLPGVPEAPQPAEEAVPGDAPDEVEAQAPEAVMAPPEGATGEPTVLGAESGYRPEGYPPEYASPEPDPGAEAEAEVVTLAGLVARMENLDVENAELRRQKHMLIKTKTSLRAKLEAVEAAMSEQTTRAAFAEQQFLAQRMLTTEERVLLDMLDGYIDSADPHRRAQYFKVLMAILVANHDTILAVLAVRDPRSREELLALVAKEDQHGRAANPP